MSCVCAPALIRRLGGPPEMRRRRSRGAGGADSLTGFRRRPEPISGKLGAHLYGAHKPALQAARDRSNSQRG